MGMVFLLIDLDLDLDLPHGNFSDTLRFFLG